METTQRLDVGQALKGCFDIGLKNVFPIIGSAILWVLTVWIPYLNIGTTIALFTVLPVKLAKGESFSPTEIFDAKYRENMTNFFLILGLVNAAIGFGLLLFIFPAIVLHLAWLLAPVLVINFGSKPIDAMNESYKATYGSKWAIFFSYLLLGIIIVIVAAIITLIVKVTSFLSYILYIALSLASIGLYFGLMAQIIKTLLLGETVAPAVEAPAVEEPLQE
jgi:hypothetical protein